MCEILLQYSEPSVTSSFTARLGQKRQQRCTSIVSVYAMAKVHADIIGLAEGQ